MESELVCRFGFNWWWISKQFNSHRNSRVFKSSATSK